jgi:hypothetical protein
VLRIAAQREDCLLKMLRDQEPLAQSATTPLWRRRHGPAPTNSSTSLHRAPAFG